MNQTTKLCAALASAGLLSLALPASAQQAAGAETRSGELNQVVVTAQKRLQSASKVPLALSVVDSEELVSKGITSAANLTDLVPNIQIGQGTYGGMEIAIRGIGSSNNTELGDPQVAFHVDGIYQGRPQSAGALFYDVERIEVLRGPQGTLYGRNANAGAINLITRKPVNRFEAGASLELGNYNTRNVEGMINVPLSSSLALRAVVSSHKHDGYTETVLPANVDSKNYDDRNNQSARLQGLLKISPNMSWLVGVDYSQDKDVGAAFFDLSNDIFPATRSITPRIQGGRDNSTTGVTSEFKATFGALDFAYIYGHRTADRDEDISFGPAPGLYGFFTNSAKQDSHELRLSSGDSGPFQWLAGLYSFKETLNNVDLDAFLNTGVRFRHFIQDPTINTSTAAFGQATYSLTPTLRATLGLRVNRDGKSRRGKTLDTNNNLIGNIGNAADGTWSKTTYRVGVEYDLSPSQMVYANVATGYKAGGFNDGNSTVGDPNYNKNLYFKPESITAYEGGLKGRFLNNTVQVGASVFYYDYKDLQRSVVPPGGTQNTMNAAKASVAGFEAEGKVAVGPNGRVNFALGLLKARYDTFTSPNGTSLDGVALDRAPKATLTLGYTHNWDLQSGARISGYLGSRYSASYLFTDPGSAAAAPRFMHQPSFTKSDLTLTYSAPSDNWSVQAFVKNIEDKSALIAPSAFAGRFLASLSEPRTMGVRGNIKF